MYGLGNCAKNFDVYYKAWPPLERMMEAGSLKLTFSRLQIAYNYQETLSLIHSPSLMNLQGQIRYFVGHGGLIEEKKNPNFESH